ncbi:hypothetical protein [Stappia indica]|uniref:hypothetical protein n=1 Tax=Stappia indica TaxID=538381 RepID=UPI00111199B3|nr:hypothetical protein [Stappia indica]
MAELKRVSGDAPAASGNFVEIVRVRNVFIADGSATSGADGPAAFFTPHPYGSFREAVRASLEWADTNHVRNVYVRRRLRKAT